MTTPEDSQIILDGMNYKIGAKGFVFYWVDDDWIRSTKTREYVENAIRDERIKKAMQEKKNHRKTLVQLSKYGL